MNPQILYEFSCPRHPRWLLAQESPDAFAALALHGLRCRRHWPWRLMPLGWKLRRAWRVLSVRAA